jgi:hypothetical protein
MTVPRRIAFVAAGRPVGGLPPGSAIDDASSVIGFVHGRRHSYELLAPVGGVADESAGVLKFRECLQSVLGPARQNHFFVANL